MLDRHFDIRKGHLVEVCERLQRQEIIFHTREDSALDGLINVGGYNSLEVRGHSYPRCSLLLKAIILCHSYRP